MSTEMDAISPGQIVGPYRFVRTLPGRGGMARVYEVEVRKKYRHQGIPRRLAMKIAEPKYQAALSAEADYLARLNHPNVVRIYPVLGYHKTVWVARCSFPFGDGWYYTMELLTGGSLHSLLCRPTTLSGLLRVPTDGEQHPRHLLEAIGIARQIAAALEHVHERSVINLDVKPSNILFRRRSFRYLRSTVPQAVLVDFGIARDLHHPRIGMLGIATPAYMSPEHAQENSQNSYPVGPWSDVFSLGIVIYEMLTGRLPFESIDEIMDPAYRPVSPREIRPATPPALESIVMRCLEKDPRRRFQSGRELRLALERVPTPLDIPAMARRALVTAVFLTFALGIWGLASNVTDHIPESIPTSVPSPTVVLISPIRPVFPSPTPRPARPTSTPRPTPTLAPTRPIPTPTPTVEAPPTVES